MASWLIPAMVAGTLFLISLGVRSRGGLEPMRLIPREPPHPAGHHRSIRWSRAAARLGRTQVGGHLGRGEVGARRLQLAGTPFGLDVLRGLQVAMGAGCGMCTLALGVFSPPALLLAPLAALAGVRAPEIILARRARRRQERIAAAVPDLVELLLATTEAGLGPAVALRRTAEILRGPLGEEVRAAVREVELGTPWQVATEHLVDRTDVLSLRALAVALTRSQRLGSALGVTLRRLVAELRRDRRTKAEELALKAPLKMLFPLVFLILPAFLLLTVGPVVLATIRALR
jgi:tight adherence protein C